MDTNFDPIGHLYRLLTFCIKTIFLFVGGMHEFEASVYTHCFTFCHIQNFVHMVYVFVRVLQHTYDILEWLKHISLFHWICRTEPPLTDIYVYYKLILSNAVVHNMDKASSYICSEHKCVFLYIYMYVLCI